MEVWGMTVRGYFVQYRFILPETIKHSSYTYQKLFRAIYGYTQAVYKSNGKTYHYPRKGILSDYPFLRPGKNCVIIPPAAFQSLQEFFKTGHNPAHNWTMKGDWKCTYFLNEKDISEDEIVKAMEGLLSRKYIDGNDGLVKLSAELKRAFENELSPTYLSELLKNAQAIVELEWFREVHSQSKELSEFYNNYKSLKAK
jgi:hypothetical protein